MKRQIKLEGGMIVEMNDGRQRHIPCSPFNGNVYHSEVGIAFGKREATPEHEFYNDMRKIVSRSSYDKR